jgi:hypothetical protein
VPVTLGLYNFLGFNPAAAAVQAMLASTSIDGVAQWPIYFTKADKQPPNNFLVIHIVDAPPAAHSQDGPSGLSDGEFQFDSCAPDSPTAQALSLALKRSLQNFSGALSDGTTIQFYKVTWDDDEGYEQGGTGYIFTHALRLRAFYTEPGS